jgi:hypothetical protein
MQNIWFALPKSNLRLVVSAISALVPQDVKSQSSAERMPIELNCRGRSLDGIPFRRDNFADKFATTKCVKGEPPAVRAALVQ